MADAAAVSLRASLRCWLSGFSASSSTANSSISGSDERITVRDLLRLLGASAADPACRAAALNFVVDPLQLFRAGALFAAMYSPDSRMQNAGLIRSQDFDTVFMGTSLAIHFRQSDIDRVLGVRSLKLAMTGSNSREQSFVLARRSQRSPPA